MTKSIQDCLVGWSFPQDRTWLIKTPTFKAYITEYNDELTGFDPRLAQLCPEDFYYGGNAYYIVNTLATTKGWIVQKVEKYDL